VWSEELYELLLRYVSDQLNDEHHTANLLKYIFQVCNNHAEIGTGFVNTPVAYFFSL